MFVAAYVLRFLIQCNGPTDYCGPEGMDPSYDEALEIALDCDTPTSWIERDPSNRWIAVCGNDDGSPRCLPVTSDDWPDMPACSTKP